MRTIVLLLIGTLVGCATPPAKDEPQGEVLYDAKAHVVDVLKNCDRTHLLFGTGASPVDCQYNYPRDMTLSFPSTSFHDEKIDEVQKFYGNWCSSIKAYTGTFPRFTRVFRRDQSTIGLVCGPAFGSRTL